MPFDYESFMTGVLTGLKLGRVPKGRKPPVPSGRYILTESGEKVLTELNPPSGDTLYSTGEWYGFASDTDTYRNRLMFTSDKSFRILHYSIGSPSFWANSFAFIASESAGDSVTVTLTKQYSLRNTSADPWTDWQNLGDPTEYEASVNHTGTSYYYFIMVGNGIARYVDMSIAVLPITPNALNDYIAALTSSPLITEGG